MSASAILTADAATFDYSARCGPVGPFTFRARSGEFHLISGRSGCGKSTLARMLCGVIPHLYRGRLHGRVLVADRRSADTPLWELSAFVGLVAQNPAAQLLASTVSEEIAFGLENLGLPRREIEARVETVLALCGLREVGARDPRTLSGGEQQKVLLAAIVARRPKAIVLDEPLSMLDTPSAVAVVALLDQLRTDGSAVVVFEHRSGAFSPIDDLKTLALPGGTVPDEPFPELANTVPAFRISVEGLGVELRGRSVLEGVDLTLAGGQVVAVVGPNGAGKTTLLRAVVGLQRHRGRVTAAVSGARRAMRLGMCFQNPDRQIFNPTVREEILFGRPHHDIKLYDNVVSLLGLSRYEDTPPLLLSEGEKKRLALAIMLMSPELCGLCLDEPTLGQDDDQRRLLGRVVRRLAGAGYLCLIATHDVAWALEWCDRLVLLRQGRIVAADAPRAIAAHPEPWAGAGVPIPTPFVHPCHAEMRSQ